MAIQEIAYKNYIVTWVYMLILEAIIIKIILKKTHLKLP